MIAAPDKHDSDMTADSLALVLQTIAAFGPGKDNISVLALSSPAIDLKSEAARVYAVAEAIAPGKVKPFPSAELIEAKAEACFAADPALAERAEDLRTRLIRAIGIAEGFSRAAEVGLESGLLAKMFREETRVWLGQFVLLIGEVSDLWQTIAGKSGEQD